MTRGDALYSILAVTGPILLDFDGPVTLLLPPGPNRDVADATRKPLLQASVPLPEDVASTSDHLTVLRFASTQPGPIREAVERAAIEGETAAALVSSPTPGAHDAMLACRQAKRPVVMVSNNAPQAIEAYLERHQLSELITAVLGRPEGRPELMKPHTALIDRALRLLSADPQTCVMVGDSLTDIEVSRRAGVHSIGYAKTPERGDELSEAGAEALIDDMTNLASAIRLISSHDPADP